MEEDNFGFISGGMYIKGLLRSYGSWLHLNEGELFRELSQTQPLPPEPSVDEVVKDPARIPPRKKPHWMLAAAVAGLILILLTWSGVTKPVDRVAAPPGTPAQAKPSAPPTPGPALAVTQQPAVQPVAPLAGGDVKLTVTALDDKSWFEAYGGPDGSVQTLFKGILAVGSTKTFEAKDKVRTRVGNLGAVRVSVNGRDLGIPGDKGKVANFIFDSATTAFIPV